MNPSGPPPVRARRDWIVLPLLSVLTILLVAGLVEWAARRIFSNSKAELQNCIMRYDPKGGYGVPDSLCREKSAEGGWVDYQFNHCGHRAGMPCGPKPQDAYRIAMTGSSLAMGARVQRENSFAGLLPDALSRISGRRVQVYNASLEWSYSHKTAMRFKEVLAAQPDLILWIITPGDVELATDMGTGARVALDVNRGGPSAASGGAWQRVEAAVASQPIGPAMSEIFGRTRTALLLRHYVYRYEPPSRYLESFYGGDDILTGDLKAQFSPHWQAMMRQVDRDIADMAAQSHAAGIPFAVTMLPSMPQFFMISVGHWPPDYAPFKLDDDVRAMAVSHGALYLTVLPSLRDIADPAQYYFLVDGHMNEAGHKLFASLVAEQLTSGAVPALKAAGAAQAPAARGT